jgi:hypothetical protein
MIYQQKNKARQYQSTFYKKTKPNKANSQHGLPRPQASGSRAGQRFLKWCAKHNFIFMPSPCSQSMAKPAAARLM